MNDFTKEELMMIHDGLWNYPEENYLQCQLLVKFKIRHMIANYDHKINTDIGKMATTKYEKAIKGLPDN